MERKEGEEEEEEKKKYKKKKRRRSSRRRRKRLINTKRYASTPPALPLSKWCRTGCCTMTPLIYVKPQKH